MSKKEEFEAFAAWFDHQEPSASVMGTCFAAWQAATAAERERCADLCDNWMKRGDITGDDIRATKDAP